jgi:hypothetical protein
MIHKKYLRTGLPGGAALREGVPGALALTLRPNPFCMFLFVSIYLHAQVFREAQRFAKVCGARVACIYGGTSVKQQVGSWWAAGILITTSMYDDYSYGGTSVKQVIII